MKLFIQNNATSTPPTAVPGIVIRSRHLRSVYTSKRASTFVPNGIGAESVSRKLSSESGGEDGEQLGMWCERSEVAEERSG
jgi:hypothetical protein